MTILLAEDDRDDRLLITRALRQHGLQRQVLCFDDGEALMRHLQTASREANQGVDLILLDLNMPRKDGHETLRELKAAPDLCRIPVVIMTTSDSEHDIARSYEEGANAYITKPASYHELVIAMRALSTFWFELAELPSSRTMNGSEAPC